MCESFICVLRITENDWGFRAQAPGGLTPRALGRPCRYLVNPPTGAPLGRAQTRAIPASAHDRAFQAPRLAAGRLTSRGTPCGRLPSVARCSQEPRDPVTLLGTEPPARGTLPCFIPSW
jgi:hypothetical protein